MQLHTSYSSLGRDFKNTFEELRKHLNSQKGEAEELRQASSIAAKSAIQVQDEISARLDVCLNEERLQAALDRRVLLSQITDLINKSGETQNSRMESKMNTIRDDLAASVSSLRDANRSYDDGMDGWLQKECLLADEVLQSRDTLKGKMKKDWTVSLLCVQTMSKWLTTFIQGN